MSFPHQLWKGADGRSGEGGTPDPYCNPFLILQTAHAKGPISPNMEARKRPIPDTLYGVLDQAEILENGSVVLIFGTVAGDWLQAQINAGGTVPTGAAGTAFYASMPLYFLEVRYEVSGLMAIAAAASLSALLEPALQTLEGIWVKITLSGSAQRASLFDNLFGAPIDVGVISIDLAVDDASQFLNSLDPLDPSQGTRDATETEIENALTAASSFDKIAIYDVGQGSANGFVSGREVGCYFDFGSGAAANTSTFPTALVNFCQCKKPPIILSHWDHDHWSSEGRDTRVHTQTWIARGRSLRA